MHLMKIPKDVQNAHLNVLFITNEVKDKKIGRYAFKSVTSALLTSYFTNSTTLIYIQTIFRLSGEHLQKSDHLSNVWSMLGLLLCLLPNLDSIANLQINQLLLFISVISCRFFC